ATLLAYEAHCALSDFRGKLAWLLVHGSILSRVGASTKLGAVHREDLSEDDRELLSAVAQAAAADIDGLHEPKPDAQFIFLKPYVGYRCSGGLRAGDHAGRKAALIFAWGRRWRMRWSHL
ncbi:hypothetical protein KDX23_33860, partial [Burkholderia vietnamiensis]|uniref:hypothetical protein n=1 Tax=Burkholderia vietnamiensis TaxID=60552 RepID=UPI001BA2D4B6